MSVAAWRHFANNLQRIRLEERSAMTNKQLTLEEQLRSYADAIDPNRRADERASAQAPQRSRPRRKIWLTAAAAVLCVAGMAVVAQRDPAEQQVVAGGFAQQPEHHDQEGTTSNAERPVIDAPPLPEDVPLTGDLRTREDALVIALAELTLIQECMSAQGVPFAMPTNDEWIESFGGWKPHGILGIGSAGAARRLGYQSAGWGGAGSPSQSAAWNAMTPAQQNAFTAALSEGLPFAPDPLPSATVTPQGRQAGGCWGFAEAMLGDYVNRGSEFVEISHLVGDDTQGEQFRSDPALANAIADWQRCVERATGIIADTPNTLAREYAFGGAASAQREREVALADVACQQESDLEVQFHIARTKQLRIELGDQATVFDDYVRFRIETVGLAQQILDERGITPPSLD